VLCRGHKLKAVLHPSFQLFEFISKRLYGVLNYTVFYSKHTIITTEHHR
jgi:hypothetical protein